MDLSRSHRNLHDGDLDFFRSIPGIHRVLQDEESLTEAGSDETEDLVFVPELVLQPETTEAVSTVMRYCYEQGIPVTPRGAGTGLSGAALPVKGGVVLDMRRFNRILHIDTENFMVRVEPGVITAELQEAVLEHGLMYPPDPASRGSCFIGGNVSHNSGGPRAVKYGVVRDYVLNLEMVLADGSVIWTGANVLKNSTGYSLTQLMIGSEGTLGVITQIVLRLVPAAPDSVLLLVPFYDAQECCRAVNRLLLDGNQPSALELMEKEALVWSMRYSEVPELALPEAVEALLLIELDGPLGHDFDPEIEKMAQSLSRFQTADILFGQTAAEKERLWKIRRQVGEAVKRESIYREVDTVVPRFQLPDLLKAVKSIGKAYGFRSVCYGHAGDGNLHINILKEDMSEDQWNQKVPKGIEEIFREVLRWGGTLSGEHGIGYVQKPYMSLAYDPVSLRLMKEIKAVFDPRGILNPGKIFQ